jgi:nitrogen fixation protein FixH
MLGSFGETRLKTCRTICITALIATLVLATACKKKPAADLEADGQLKLTLAVSPERPRMSRPATLRVHVTDPTSNPVMDAVVTGTMTMKIMDMPPVPLTFTSVGNGFYETTMNKLDMSGPWGIKVVAKQGGTQSTENFEVTVFE